MNEEEFLARWSRRKSEARADKEALPPAQPVEVRDPAPPAGTLQAPAMPEVDLSSLPSLDSIDAATDITAFLRRGIPQELSREALRRAWSADPAIRDFVGLAENAWDFNDPNAMPGFGPLDLSVEQLAAFVERIVGGERSAESPAATAADQQQSCGAAKTDPERERVPESFADEAAAAVVRGEDLAAESPVSVAAQQEPLQRNHVSDALQRRVHGGALPR